MIDTLLIACGNPLRGDDGVAAIAAEAVMRWQITGVRVTIVHQLTPELIDEMKNAGRVIFVDAATDTGDAAMMVRRVQAKRSRSFFGHHETPENLLALMATLENHVPEAWLVSIRALSFGHGAPITEETRIGIDEAIAWIRQFCRSDHA